MSKDKITVKMVEQKYRAGIQAFARTLGDPTLRLNFMQEADPFFRRCALAVWKHGSPVTGKYVDTYNAICSGENAAPSILFFELCAAVEGAPEFAPPPFFADLARADRTSRRNSAKKFTELCSILLLLFAAVDDEVTAEDRRRRGKGRQLPPAGLYHLRSQCIQDPDASKSRDNSR